MNGSVFFFSFSCSRCSRYFWVDAFFYRSQFFFLSIVASHNENHCISNSLWSKGVCRCVNWLFAYDTWFLFLLIVIFVCFLCWRSHTHIFHIEHATRCVFQFLFRPFGSALYCYAFGLIYSCVFFFLPLWLRLQYMAKVQCIWYLCMCQFVISYVFFLLFLLVLMKRDEQRASEIVFHFALLFHSHFDENRNVWDALISRIQWNEKQNFNYSH